MRAALIVNGKSGRLSALPDPDVKLAAALAEAGFHIAVEPDGTLPLDEQWSRALGSSAEVIFVAGGDGTLRDAAARLLDDGRIFAPLPGGTMNRVCTRLGLPPDPVDAARAYRPGATIGFDVATANGEVFLYQSMLGPPTRLIRFREMQRGSGWRGWWPLLKATLRMLMRPAHRLLHVRLDPHRVIRGHAAVVTLPLPGSEAGLLLSLARPRGIITRLRQGVRWFRGRLAEDPDVAARQGARLAVHSGSPFLRLSLDGEARILAAPVRFRLHRGALRALAPPGVT